MRDDEEKARIFCALALVVQGIFYTMPLNIYENVDFLPREHREALRV